MVVNGVVRVPRSRALVPIAPKKGVQAIVDGEAVLSWGTDGEHPVLGDIIAKPTPTGYEVVGACDACKTRVNINMRFGDSEDVALTAAEALKRALLMHPTPPEPFDPSFRVSRMED